MNYFDKIAYKTVLNDEEMQYVKDKLHNAKLSSGNLYDGEPYGIEACDAYMAIKGAIKSINPPYYGDDQDKVYQSLTTGWSMMQDELNYLMQTEGSDPTAAGVLNTMAYCLLKDKRIPRF